MRRPRKKTIRGRDKAKVTLSGGKDEIWLSASRETAGYTLGDYAQHALVCLTKTGARNLVRALQEALKRTG